MITPEKFDDDSTSMVFESSNRDPLEQMIAGDYNENKRQRKMKRKRLNSGSL